MHLWSYRIYDVPNGRLKIPLIGNIWDCEFTIFGRAPYSFTLMLFMRAMLPWVSCSTKTWVGTGWLFILCLLQITTNYWRIIFVYFINTILNMQWKLLHILKLSLWNNTWCDVHFPVLELSTLCFFSKTKVEVNVFFLCCWRFLNESFLSRHYSSTFTYSKL